MSTPAAARIAFTPAEAAQALGVSEHYFREHIEHELPWVRRGRKRLVSRVELEQWLASNGEWVLG